jgi:hypothetical protein
MRKLTVALCLTIAVLLGSDGMSESADYNKGKFYIWFVASFDIREDKTSITTDYSTFYTEEDCKKKLMQGLTDQTSSIASELRISGNYTVRQHTVGKGVTLTKKYDGGGRQEVTCIDKNLTDPITYDNWVKAVKLQSK